MNLVKTTAELWRCYPQMDKIIMRCEHTDVSFNLHEKLKHCHELAVWQGP